TARAVLAFKERPRPSADPADGAVAEYEPMLHLIHAVPRRVVGAPDGRRDRRAVLVVYALDERRQGDRLLRAPAADGARLGRPVDGIGAMIVLENAEAGDLDRLPQPVLARAQGLAGQPAIVNVGDGADPAHHRAEVVLHRHRPRDDPVVLAVVT